MNVLAIGPNEKATGELEDDFAVRPLPMPNEGQQRDGLRGDAPATGPTAKVEGERTKSLSTTLFR